MVGALMTQVQAVQKESEPLRSLVRPPRLQPHQRPDYRTVPPCRLVVFLRKLRIIITILSKSRRFFHSKTSTNLSTVNKNWHNEKGDVDPSSNVLRFVPRTASRDPSFVASILRPRILEEHN